MNIEDEMKIQNAITMMRIDKDNKFKLWCAMELLKQIQNNEMNN
jgi:hypothetical protein